MNAIGGFILNLIWTGGDRSSECLAETCCLSFRLIKVANFSYNIAKQGHVRAYALLSSCFTSLQVEVDSCNVRPDNTVWSRPESASATVHL